MNASGNYDYIIVGQGLAGSLLSFFLHKKGYRLLIIDPGHTAAASMVAAGIINPVTGRRYVKSWRIDELLPFARQSYAELEALLGIPLYETRHILRALFSPTELNHWTSRLGDPDYESYILPQASSGAWPALIHPLYAFGEIAQAAQVNLRQLLLHVRDWLQSHHLLLAENFRYDDLHRAGDLVQYGDYSAKAVVFCEGFQAKKNPWFGHLPYEGAKGEVLRIRIHGEQPEKMLRHHFFLVPMDDGSFWAGSNYRKREEDGAPTPEGKTWLINQLEKILSAPYDIVSHQAAIRPTTDDRRPLLGEHSDFPNLFIFNGLGTKGASQGPFFAAHMADFLAGEVALDPEVDIRRFHAKTR